MPPKLKPAELQNIAAMKLRSILFFISYLLHLCPIFISGTQDKFHKDLPFICNILWWLSRRTSWMSRNLNPGLSCLYQPIYPQQWFPCLRHLTNKIKYTNKTIVKQYWNTIIHWDPSDRVVLYLQHLYNCSSFSSIGKGATINPI